VKSLIDVAVPAITFALLVTIGCDLRAADLRRLLGRPGIVLAGLFLPLLALPALALGLIVLFEPPAAVAAGLLIVAACPIGGLSNFYSHLAGASVALSVALTGLSCLVAVLPIPALGAAFERLLDRPLGLNAPLPLLLAQIILMLALPVSLGMWANRRGPRLVERHRTSLRRASLVALSILLALIVLSDLGGFLDELPATLPLAAAFVAASFVAGWLAGLAFRADARDRFTLAAEFATRNVAVAATLAVTLLHRVEFATFATTYVLTEAPLPFLAAIAFRARVAAAPAVE
jgi:BASS family bile acid:Na+ symporter